MPKNQIQDLRNHLFETLEMLKDGDIEPDKAKMICEVSKQIIDTARVEVQFMNIVGGTGTGFIPNEVEETTKPKLLN